MNDAVILLCGVILLLAVLPMILMGRAFKSAGTRKDAAGSDGGVAGEDSGAAKAKSGHTGDDSSSFDASGSGDGGGGGK